MTASPVEMLAQRVDRLERENRWLKRIGGLVSIGLVAVLLLGQAAPKRRIVEAEMFVLRDTNSRIRATIGPDSFTEQAPIEPYVYDSSDIMNYGLRIYDATRRYRAGIIESRQGARIELHADNTPTSAYLSASDGAASLDLRATDQTRQAADRERDEWARKFNAARTREERSILLRGEPFDGITARVTAFPRGTLRIPAIVNSQIAPW